jgi:hypothetical protein
MFMVSRHDESSNLRSTLLNEVRVEAEETVLITETDCAHCEVWAEAKEIVKHRTFNMIGC